MSVTLPGKSGVRLEDAVALNALAVIADHRLPPVSPQERKHSQLLKDM